MASICQHAEPLSCSTFLCGTCHLLTHTYFVFILSTPDQTANIHTVHCHSPGAQNSVWNRVGPSHCWESSDARMKEQTAWCFHSCLEGTGHQVQTRRLQQDGERQAQRSRAVIRTDALAGHTRSHRGGCVLLCSGCHKETPETGQLTRQKCISSQSWRLKSKIKVQQRWLVGSHLVCPHMIVPLLEGRVGPCVQMSSSCKDTRRTESGDTLRGSFYINDLCEGLKKQSHSEY